MFFTLNEKLSLSLSSYKIDCHYVDKNVKIIAQQNYVQLFKNNAE